MAREPLSAFESDIKHPDMDPEKGDRMARSPLAHRSRPLAVGFAIVALLYIFWSSLIPGGLSFAARLGRPCHLSGHAASKTPVPLEAHIMSKCPDARDCLKMMVLPTMQRVHDKVNFTLSYIGT
jgi:hypothetical protein